MGTKTSVAPTAALACTSILICLSRRQTQFIRKHLLCSSTAVAAVARLSADKANYSQGWRLWTAASPRRAVRLVVTSPAQQWTSATPEITVLQPESQGGVPLAGERRRRKEHGTSSSKASAVQGFYFSNCFFLNSGSNSGLVTQTISVRFVASLGT